MKLAAQLLVAALLAWLAASADTPSPPPVDPAALMAKYGPPDRETSNADDPLRPPMRLRELEYEPEGVRFVLQADAAAGWRLLRVTDLHSGRLLLSEEVDARMAARRQRASAPPAPASAP